MLDVITQIVVTVGLIVLLGTATYTLIASEIRQRRLDKQYEDSMKRLIELREQDCVCIDDVDTIDETAGYGEGQEHDSCEGTR